MAWIKAIKEEDIEKLVEYLRSEQFESAGHLDMNDVGQHLRKFLSNIEVVEQEEIKKEAVHQPSRLWLGRAEYEIMFIKERADIDADTKLNLAEYIHVEKIIVARRKGIVYTILKYTSGKYSKPELFTL